jgi:hypothetical protein
MIRALVSLVAATLLASASVTVDAQDDTVVRVDYVAVVVQADGTESPHSEGVHYIASDGRHRHDRTPAGGTPTSEYRLPRDGVHVSVNHSLLEAVRSGRIPPVNVASPVGRGTPPAVASTTEIGERTLGPIRLQGRAEVREGFGRTEYWMHEPPLMETAADPLAYPPIVIEMTMFMDSGARFEVRATSARRIPPAPDMFTVPRPVP